MNIPDMRHVVKLSNNRMVDFWTMETMCLHHLGTEVAKNNDCRLIGSY